jgi:hypothetical protein
MTDTQKKIGLVALIIALLLWLWKKKTAVTAQICDPTFSSCVQAVPGAGVPTASIGPALPTPGHFADADPSDLTQWTCPIGYHSANSITSAVPVCVPDVQSPQQKLYSVAPQQNQPCPAWGCGPMPSNPIVINTDCTAPGGECAPPAPVSPDNPNAGGNITLPVNPPTYGPKVYTIKTPPVPYCDVPGGDCAPPQQYGGGISNA